jgi:hypothetical protein
MLEAIRNADTEIQKLTADIDLLNNNNDIIRFNC